MFAATTMMGLRRYVALSTLASAAVVYHAFSTREQYFPAMYYMSTSKISIAVMGNVAFAMALCCYRLITKLFLGALRESEVERINDRISQAVMETCLAMTIFREEFNVEFVAMFTVLTFVKVFHWLVQDRVDYLETTPTVSRLQHLRIIGFMAVLLAWDAVALKYTVGKTLQRSASVHLLFAFEYVIQASIVCATGLKYCLSALDGALEGGLENKGVYVFYLELLTDMLHLCVYIIFFVIVFTNYGLPLHLVRDLYWTARNFRNRVADFLRYRRVTANMDERFREATPEDLARCDGTCIICREEMAPTTRNKRLPCAHVFHLHCLRSWLERQQNCPICRTSVFGPPAAAAGAPHDAAAPELPAGAAAGGVGQQQQQQQQAEGRPQRRRFVVRIGPEGVQLHRPNEAAQHPYAGFAPPQGGAAQAQGQADAGQPQMPQQQQQAQAQAQGGPWQGGGTSGDQQQAQQAQQAQAQMPWGAQNYGFAWNVPQAWVPHTSMALFVPAHGYHPLQFAGQQNPESATPDYSIPAMGGMLPMMPLMLPPPSFPTLFPPPPPGATLEQQQQHMAAAAAAAAAASVMSPFGHMMMPPTMLPQGPMPILPTISGAMASHGGAPISHQTATAAASAAAAAAAVVLGAPVTSAAPSEGTAASADAMRQMLNQQMQLLQAQMQMLRTQQAPAQLRSEASLQPVTSSAAVSPQASPSGSVSAEAPPAPAANPAEPGRREGKAPATEAAAVPASATASALPPPLASTTPLWQPPTSAAAPSQSVSAPATAAAQPNGSGTASAETAQQSAASPSEGGQESAASSSSPGGAGAALSPAELEERERLRLKRLARFGEAQPQL